MRVKINKKTTTFRLPKIELLEQNSNRISLTETNKNKHSADFMEKYFDFGIEGKIKN